MSETRVEDAISAQSAARRYVEAQFSRDKIKELAFSRAWYSAGSQRDVWEVEGDVVVKKGRFSKEHRHFKFQIDPENGRVIAYEG